MAVIRVWERALVLYILFVLWSVYNYIHLLNVFQITVLNL